MNKKKFAVYDITDILIPENKIVIMVDNIKHFLKIIGKGGAFRLGTVLYGYDMDMVAVYHLKNGEKI